MKKFILMTALLLMGIGSSPVIAREANQSPWEISGMVGGVFPIDEEQNITIYGGGRLIYNINEHIGIGLESGWMNFEQEVDGLDFGNIQGIPLMAEAIFKLPIEATENTVVPYALGGVGVVFWNYDESALLTSNGISVDSDTALAVKIGGGIDFYVTDTIALFGEGGYMWSNYESNINASGSVIAASSDTDMAYAVAGIKFGF